jgi:hypothetical protein
MALEEFLSLIQHARLVLQEEPCILASPEDARYFRSKYERQASPALPTPSLQKLEKAMKPQTLSPAIASIPSELPQPGRIEAPKTSLAPKQQESLEPSISLEKEVAKAANNEKTTSLKEGEISSSHPSERKMSEAPPPMRDSGGIKQFRVILEKIAPTVKIFDAIPSDALAKQLSNRWKTKNQSAPISILSSGELPQHKALLKEIATALDVYFGPARIIDADPIEKEKQWKLFLSSEGLKRIVICDSTLWQLVALRQFYKETPGSEIRMLENIPVFLLPDLSLYLKDPQLKRFLWKALCSKCS